MNALPTAAKLGHITLFIQQDHFQQWLPSPVPGNSLVLPLCSTCLMELILLISQQRIVVVIHDGFRLAFHFNAALFSKNGAIAGCFGSPALSWDTNSSVVPSRRNLRIRSENFYAGNKHRQRRAPHRDDQHIRANRRGHAKGAVTHLHTA